MVSIQALRPRVTVGLLTLLASLAGCHSGARHADTPPPSLPVASGAGVPDTAADTADLTATEAAIAAGPAQTTTQSTSGPAVDSSILNPTAPKSYVVKRGDTLWGIASMFLKDPWLWPEVWYVNPQVNNPHLIYPGDTLALAIGADGRPQVRLVEEQGNGARISPRLRSTAADGAIPTIPYSAISAFLSRPTVLTAEQIRSLPYVLAFREEHVVGGAGHEIYVRNLKGVQNERFTVVHVGDELRDPDDGKVLGYEGIYTGTALVSKEGNPAKALLTDTERETLQGDLLLATDTDVPLNFMLRAPRNDVHGKIMAVIDGTQLIGQWQIVVINKGKRQGVDAGDVLAVDQAGADAVDYQSAERHSHWLGGFGSSFAPKVKLPDERGGTLLVFKSFDRLSYALVVGASTVIHTGDVVRNP
ncbi:MAG TPA: LysM peptidoglycan-binding domain-containing protein [Steroidobacteraceae bacterium]